MSAQKPYRLPSTITPERYEIRLTPDLSNWTFAGEQKVLIRVVEPVREIVLNAAELEFHSVSLKLPGGKMLPGSARLDSDNEQATLDFPDTLPSGLCELRNSFAGNRKEGSCLCRLDEDVDLSRCFYRRRIRSNRCGNG